jgi:hypothetical protein
VYWSTVGESLRPGVPRAGLQGRPAANCRGGRLLTPKFGKESDLWVRLDEESVWWKAGSFQRYSAKRSAVGYLLPFGKGTVELRDWMVTWLKQEGRMDR